MSTPTIRSESLHEISNDNGVTVVNFTTSTNLITKSTKSPHCNIHKYTQTSSDGKTHNPIDHILMDRRRQSTVVDIQFFRGVKTNTKYYLVTVKVTKRLAVSKQMDKFQRRGSSSRN
jgi:hypothetical protein